MSMLAQDTPSVTRDTFWHGRLAVWQPARGHGYRFNLDPVVLARFCPVSDAAVELGAGCGILSLLLLASGKVRRIQAVEVQPLLADLARRNALENGLKERLSVLQADLREIHGPRVDLVAFNPPYFSPRARAVVRRIHVETPPGASNTARWRILSHVLGVW